MTNIESNEVFRNSNQVEEPFVDGYPNFKHVARGRHTKSIDHQKGMPRYARLKEGPRRGCVPATFFHSKEKAEEYHDTLDVGGGYVRFYGDNGWKGERPPHASAEDSHGIERFSDVEQLYFSDDRKEREEAPPILITQGFKKEGRAMRRFIGVGVLLCRDTIIQPHDKGGFENVVYHAALIDLPEGLDWDWIDDRRDPGLNTEEALLKAPASWLEWVEQGHEALSHIPIGRSAERSDLPTKEDPFVAMEEEDEEPDDGTGYVYAITNPAWEGHVKIGQARDPSRRLGNYQTYSPKRDYQLKHSVRCEDRAEAESRAHSRAATLAYGRRMNEWFRISIEQAKTVLDQLGEPAEV